MKTIDKTKIKQIITVFSVIFLFAACQKELETKKNKLNDPVGNAQLTENLKDLNENFQTRLKPMPAGSKTLDWSKVKKLAISDGFGALGCWQYGATPIIGPYVVTWGAFLSTYASSKTVSGGDSPPVRQRVDVNEIDRQITIMSSVDNPAINIGRAHNIAMNDLGTANQSIINGDLLSPEFIIYMKEFSFDNLSETQKLDAVLKFQTVFVTIYKEFNAEPDIDKYFVFLDQNESIPEDAKLVIRSTTKFVYENLEPINPSLLTEYIDGVEAIVANASLEIETKNGLYRFLSVLNYSGCFWYTQENQ